VAAVDALAAVVEGAVVEEDSPVEDGCNDITVLPSGVREITPAPGT
jgi:hypothetical protein